MESGGPEFEILHGAADYTAEELLEQCQLNAQSLMLAVAAVLPENQDWPNTLASVFARAWETDRRWDPAEVLDATLTNLRAFGAEIVRADFDQTPPAATVRHLPDPDLVNLLGATPAQADAILRVSAALAARLGMELTWHRAVSGDVTIAVEPPSAS